MNRTKVLFLSLFAFLMSTNFGFANPASELIEGLVRSLRVNEIDVVVSQEKDVYLLSRRGGIFARRSGLVHSIKLNNKLKMKFYALQRVRKVKNGPIRNEDSSYIDIEFLPVSAKEADEFSFLAEDYRIRLEEIVEANKVMSEFLMYRAPYNVVRLKVDAVTQREFNQFIEGAYTELREYKPKK